ncbi:MAG TPA: hypothetical protein PKG52_09845 [bacterium]|nr:hypothetical protein [bacterium]HPS31195.1 hypothetical protein [bacterium]
MKMNLKSLVLLIIAVTFLSTSLTAAEKKEKTHVVGGYFSMGMATTINKVPDSVGNGQVFLDRKF